MSSSEKLLGKRALLSRANISNVAPSRPRVSLLEASPPAVARSLASSRRSQLRLRRGTLGILERWVYEGVIDGPYGEFSIAEKQFLERESLTQDYDAKYWRQRYSLKDGIPSFLANIAWTILITGKYLNVMRECGHHVQALVSENSQMMSFTEQIIEQQRSLKSYQRKAYI